MPYDTHGIKPPEGNNGKFVQPQNCGHKPLPTPPPPITPPPYIKAKLAIDKTLTKENYAADALVVGTLIKEIYQILDEIDVEELVEWMNENKDLLAYLQEIVDVQDEQIFIDRIDGNGNWE